MVKNHKKERTMKKILLAISAIMTIGSAVAGCGSGTPEAQQKTATITFSAMSTASLPTAISGVEISAKLPAGVSVFLQPGSANQIGGSALASVKPNGFILGSYSSSIRQVTIAVADNAQPPKGLGFGNIGDFATLECTFSPSLTLTENSFLGINQTFPDFKATGVFKNMSGTRIIGTVDLTNKLKPSMKVTIK